MRTLLFTALLLNAGCIMDDGAIDNTCDERPEGCGNHQPTDTGDTASG